MPESAQGGRRAGLHAWGRHVASLGCRFRVSLVWDSGLPIPALSSPHALAVGGHVSEDPKQELARVARLEGGGDDDKAALGLVGPQEDTAGVDVDGAGGPVLHAVHAVAAVLLHLRGEGGWAARTPPPRPRPPAASRRRERPGGIHVRAVPRKGKSAETGVDGCLPKARGWATRAGGAGGRAPVVAAEGGEVSFRGDENARKWWRWSHNSTNTLKVTVRSEWVNCVVCGLDLSRAVRSRRTPGPPLVTTSGSF